MTKEENKNQDKYTISEVTQVAGYVVKDTITGTEYDLLSAISKIMNDIDKIKKNLLGD